MTLTEDNDVRLRIERDFVETLARCPLLREESSRELLVATLGRRLGGELNLRKQTTARMNIMELVHVCAGQDRGLELLVDQVRFVDPLAPELPDLSHLCDEWQAAHTLADIWLDLRATLLPLRLTVGGDAVESRLLRELAALATESRLQELPKQCSTLWRLFVYLVGANTGPQALPPCMVLLDCVADRVVDGTLARTVRGWNANLAERWQLTDQVAACSSRTENHRNENQSVYLIIQVDPDAMDSGRLLISHWRQWDPDAWRPQRGDDKVIAAPALESEVDNLIAGMEIELGTSVEAARIADIRLEFVLPAELLNFPVQHLRKSALADETVPLTVDHPVVIRSLERLRMPRLHLAWHRRWARMTGEQARPYWSQPSGAEYFVRLITQLHSDERIVSLVLSEPPEPGNKIAAKEINAALRAGIPAIIWHRIDCSSPEFRKAVTTMVADGALVQLPERVTELRRAALQFGAATPGHPGWEIALLWDDATRFPEPPKGMADGRWGRTYR
jgi:NTP-dependent ternary conflict system VMAP-like protein/effector-associated domain 2 (EAD2)-containing protein